MEQEGGVFASERVVRGKEREEMGEMVELARETIVGCVDFWGGEGIATGDGGAAVGGRG